jgi:hypothetical protein
MSESPDLFAGFSTQPYSTQPSEHALRRLVDDACLLACRYIPNATADVKRSFVLGFLAGKCHAVQDVVDLLSHIMTVENVAFIDNVLNAS